MTTVFGIIALLGALLGLALLFWVRFGEIDAGRERPAPALLVRTKPSLDTDAPPDFPRTSSGRALSGQCSARYVLYSSDALGMACHDCDRPVYEHWHIITGF